MEHTNDILYLLCILKCILLFELAVANNAEIYYLFAFFIRESTIVKDGQYNHFLENALNSLFY